MPRDTIGLRRGWTTGACAAAAARAAFAGLRTGRDWRWPSANRRSTPGRAMIAAALADEAAALGMPPPDATITVLIPGGQRLAEKTMNTRLCIVGGLSVLGTTGIVIPYSCSSWIHSLRRGIDVARAAGLAHIAAATGKTSEQAVQRLYALPQQALIDMGDFAGGMLKYLRRHPVARLTIAGGFAKMAKLADAHLDLHSARSRVDPAALARRLAVLGGAVQTGAAAGQAKGASEILALAGARREALAQDVARRAREVALAMLAGDTAVEVAIVDRALVARAQ
jgi:cobalt-precorrin-5B (C1)-methyltransferase